MRFTPHRGIYAYERTNRKLKAAARRLRLDREKFPLFTEEIGESQPSPEQLLDARARSFVTSQQDNRDRAARNWWQARAELRSEEHTSELQSLMRISYAVFCLKQKTKTHKH